jgi:hypothetical protein
MTRSDTKTFETIGEDLNTVADAVTGEAGGPGTFRYRVTGDGKAHDRVEELLEDYDVSVAVEGNGRERSYYLTEQSE